MCLRMRLQQEVMNLPDDIFLDDLLPLLFSGVCSNLTHY